MEFQEMGVFHHHRHSDGESLAHLGKAVKCLVQFRTKLC
jgi:hypothetical protein